LTLKEIKSDFFCGELSLRRIVLFCGELFAVNLLCGEFFAVNYWFEHITLKIGVLA
jgi:hypothetical protein